MNFQLSERIPTDNFYRKLKESLDLNSISKETRELYGSTGNPSIDLVVFRPATRFKLMLVGYLENITFDRKLVDHCSVWAMILTSSCPGIQPSAGPGSYIRLPFLKVYSIRYLLCVLTRAWSVDIHTQWTAAAAVQHQLKPMLQWKVLN
ncbi:hypothetical protein [Dyadobacter alkalitolerans]|uniref:hypothetical protein n=1 Tax=Dyadobacter alkalitolerans TaxID=492736 RepID=UPI00146FA961|nr:hypothetical protein [Dyadobacter alkalitolerans]